MANLVAFKNALAQNPQLKLLVDDLMVEMGNKYDERLSSLEASLMAKFQAEFEVKIKKYTSGHAPGAHPHGFLVGSPNPHCGCPTECDGNKCGNQCDGPLMMPPFFTFPACYKNCKKISRCLALFFCHARMDFDEWAWLELNKSELPIVHLNRIVGADPPYESTLPLAAGEKILFAQELKQELPFEPGMIKIANAQWSGDPKPAQVKITFYTGDRGLTDIVDPADAGLIVVGRPMTLDDCECKDDCWLVEWPELFGCKSAAIPHRRMLYVQVELGAEVEQSELTDIGITVLKRHTREHVKWAKKCGCYNDHDDD